MTVIYSAQVKADLMHEELRRGRNFRPKETEGLIQLKSGKTGRGVWYWKEQCANEKATGYSLKDLLKCSLLLSWRES